MSASASNADTKTETTNQQQSTQGASGAGSPTITAAGGVTYNDQSGLVAQQSLGVIGDLVARALGNSAAVNESAFNAVSDLNSRALETTSAQANNDSGILAQALQSQAALATTKGTGGFNLASQTYNYLIFGAVGIAALVIVLLMRKK